MSGSYNGTGEGVSAACPKGRIVDLVYLPDTKPAFHSTGNLAGPCGAGYADL